MIRRRELKRKDGEKTLLFLNNHYKDINGDGLKDAVVSTCFVDNGIEAEGTPHIHRLFLQTDNWVKCETAWIDPEEGTWKQEYENCMAAMEQGISERGMAGREL